MSLRHVLLATLSHGKLSGYDIMKKFDGLYAHVWQASHQQIYRELKMLHKNGYIDQSIIQQTERPNKKVYELTDEGKSELQGWLSKPSESLPQKSPLLAKFFVSSLWDDADKKQELELLKKECEETAKMYEELESYWVKDEQMATDSEGAYQALQLVRKLNQARLEWLEELDIDKEK